MSSDVVTLPVHHARLKINSTCVILLTSLDDQECPGYLTPPSQPTTTSSHIATEMMITSGFTGELTTTAQPTSMGSEGEPQMTGGSERETVPPVVTKQTEVATCRYRSYCGWSYCNCVHCNDWSCDSSY
jgi:hypothetical protein